MQVIPFKCIECGVDFSYREGGKCSKCGKLFCNNHLYEVKIGKETILLCNECKGDKKVIKKKSSILKIRERLQKLNRDEEKIVSGVDGLLPK